MKYRAEIDGLRAVAVVPVILFHGGVAGFSGGFVGVDVFFVISGYLIATLVVRDLDAGRFSLAQFYERRARRILPALVLVVVLVIPFAWMWMLPDDLEAFAKSILGVATFSSNIVFWRESGYFDTAADLKPLLHTWSLAVEEQFYMFFPPLLMMLWRVPCRIVVPTLAACFFLSFAIALWGVGHKPNASFYLLPTRAWEILIGVGCALWLLRKPPATGPVAAGLAVVGIGLLAYSILAFDATTAVPGLPILLPTLGTALVILFANLGTVAHRILSWRPFVAIGLVSYSAYLWHQPILALARYRFEENLTVGGLAICLALTALLATLSWAWIERPFRSPELLTRSRIFELSACALAGLVAVALIGTLNMFDIRHARWPDLYAGQAERRAHPAKSPEAVPTGRPIVLWGDSYARALEGELRKSVGPSDFRIVPFHLPSCPSILGYRKRGGDPAFLRECDAFRTQSFESIRALAASDPDFHYVVLTSFYSQLLGWDDPDGASPPEPGDVPAPVALARTVGVLTGLGLTPIVVLPHPAFQDFDVGIRQLTSIPPDIWTSTEESRSNSSILTSALAESGAILIDTLSILCPDAGPGCRAFLASGEPYVEMDGHHLSARGAEIVARAVAEAINADATSALSREVAASR